MSEWGRMAGRLPNYVRRFGWREGIRLLWSVERPFREDPQKVQALRVPGFAGPIHLRDTLSDRSIFWQCIVRDQYEFRAFPQAARWYQQYRDAVAKGSAPVLVDCGGNIGLSVVWFAQAFPDLRVVVVEPDAANLDILRRNVEPWRERVTVVQGGVWHTTCALGVTNREGGSAGLRVEPVPPGTPDAVQAYTVPELCNMAGGGPMVIVKIDVEGAQQAIFSGDTAWLASSALVMLELDDWQLPWRGTSRPFFRAIAQHPYDYLLAGELIVCFRDDQAVAVEA